MPPEALRVARGAADVDLAVEDLDAGHERDGLVHADRGAVLDVLARGHGHRRRRVLGQVGFAARGDDDRRDLDRRGYQHDGDPGRHGAVAAPADSDRAEADARDAQLQPPGRRARERELAGCIGGGAQRGACDLHERAHHRRAVGAAQHQARQGARRPLCVHVRARRQCGGEGEQRPRGGDAAEGGGASHHRSGGRCERGALAGGKKSEMLRIFP
jgi:hypothetical protein